MVATEMMQRYKKLQFERGESAQEQTRLLAALHATASAPDIFHHHDEVLMTSG